MGRDVLGGKPDRHYVDSDPYVVVDNALDKADQSLVYLWIHETFRQNVNGQSQRRPRNSVCLVEFFSSHSTIPSWMYHLISMFIRY